MIKIIKTPFGLLKERPFFAVVNFLIPEDFSKKCFIFEVRMAASDRLLMFAKNRSETN